MATARNSRLLPEDTVVRSDGLHSPTEERARALRETILRKWSSAQYSSLSKDLQEYQSIKGVLDEELQDVSARLAARVYVQQIRTTREKVEEQIHNHNFSGAWNLVARILPIPPSIPASEKGATEEAYKRLCATRDEIPNRWITSIEAAVRKACESDKPAALADAEAALGSLRLVPIRRQRKERIEATLTALITEAKLRFLESKARSHFRRYKWDETVAVCSEMQQLDPKHRVAHLLKKRALARSYAMNLGLHIAEAKTAINRGDYSTALRSLKAVPQRPEEVPPQEEKAVAENESSVEALIEQAVTGWMQRIEEEVISICAKQDADISLAETVLEQLLQVPTTAARKESLRQSLRVVVTEATIRRDFERAKRAEEICDWTAVIGCCRSVLALDTKHGAARDLLDKARREAEIDRLCSAATQAYANGLFDQCLDICTSKDLESCGDRHITSAAFTGQLSDLRERARRKHLILIESLQVIAELRSRGLSGPEDERSLASAADTILELSPGQQDALSAVQHLNTLRRRRMQRRAVAIVAASIACFTAGRMLFSFATLLLRHSKENQKGASIGSLSAPQETKPSIPSQRHAAEYLLAPVVAPREWAIAMHLEDDHRNIVLDNVANIAAHTLHFLTDNPLAWYDLSKIKDEDLIRKKALSGDQWCMRLIAMLNASRFQGSLTLQDIADCLSAAAKSRIPAAITASAVLKKPSTPQQIAQETHDLLREAADMGCVEAKYLLGQRLIESNPHEAVALLEGASSIGHVEASVLLGEILFRKSWSDQARRDALSLWRSAWASGSWRALALIGLALDSQPDDAGEIGRRTEAIWTTLEDRAPRRVAIFLEGAYREGRLVPINPVASARWSAVANSPVE